MKLPPSLVDKGKARFYSTDYPNDDDMDDAVNRLCQNKIAVVARACEPLYSADALAKAGISVLEFKFDDGRTPSPEVLKAFLTLVEKSFYAKEPELEQDQRICVHCVAGLGRAPVLVAIALIEFERMEPLAAVSFVRSVRKGAFNTLQLRWLETYQRGQTRDKSDGQLGCCAVM